MNTQSISKNMNGMLELTDGEITISNGSIVFSDGTVLDSIDDIALKSADNTFTGTNVFDNNITSIPAPLLNTHLTNKLYVDDAIANETTSILASDNTFTGYNTFNNNVSTLTELPTLDSHLTNKYYVDDAIANETTSILASDNTFTGINTFSNKLITTDISNNGSLKVNGVINDLTIGRWGSELGSIIFGETGTTKTGDFNTIIGTNTFRFNTTGVLNTTLGRSTLRSNTTGDGNLAIGFSALYANTTGDHNSGVGFGSLNVNTIGTNNSSIGYYSGGNQKTGNNNTFLGSNAKVASLSGTYNNSTAIGYNSSIDASNQIVMGTTTEYVKIPSIKASTEYTNGALVVSGGVGIAENLRVNGRAIFNDIFAGDEGYFSTNLLVNGNFTTNGALDVSGASVFKSDVSITSTTTSTLPTNGALVVSGGVGVAGALIVDGPLRTTYNSGSGATNYFMKEGFTATWNVCSGTGEVDFVNTTPDATFVVDTGFRFFTNVVGQLFSKLASQNSWYCDINPSVSIFKSGLSITSTTTSSLPTNGALVVNGGVGIAENLNVGGMIKSANNSNTKKIVLYDNSVTENPVSATNFFGFGIESNTVRYQVPTSTAYHKFYNGSTSTLSVGNGIASITGDLNVDGMIKSVNNINNKKIVLFDSGPGDPPLSATNFYGFGINSSTLRYQVSTPAQYHRFHCGGTLNLEVGNGIVNIPISLNVGGQSSITNTTATAVNLTATPITVSTATANTALRVAGDMGVVGSLIVNSFFRCNYNIPLYDSGWFIVATNTSYASPSLSAYLSYNATKYPYTIKVNYRPLSSSFPVYDITGQCFNYNFADGYGFRWVDATNYVIRTGTGSVAKYHDGANYITGTTGSYRVYVYA